MKTKLTLLTPLAGTLLALSAAPGLAQSGPFYEGGYISPMATYADVDTDRIDSGYGGTLALGYRWHRYALEIAAIQLSLDDGGFDVSPEAVGGAFNGLWFVSERLPNLYAIASAGALSVEDYPVIPGGLADPDTSKNVSITRLGAGAGYLFPISLGRYEFGLRLEALYVAGRRDKDIRQDDDVDVPRRIDTVVANLGLTLPLGRKAVEIEPEPEPVRVVEPYPTTDSDGDGVIDSMDDCPGTPAGAEVDARGCELPPPPPPPCNPPGSAAGVSLEGCEVGTKLVLQGVNFEFDSARLTANAKTILDLVADALNAYPDIEIEIAGHTDALGTESYNQTLSEQRAAAVTDYLRSRGVSGSRMQSAGYGESRPVEDNADEAGRERNRRVELEITAAHRM